MEAHRTIITAQVFPEPTAKNLNQLIKNTNSKAKRGGSLRILNVEDGKKRKGIIIKAIIGVPEFEQLAGNLDNLCVFATKTVTERSTAIKSGSRHQYSKYLLLPVSLRRKLKTTDFDYQKLVCGTVEYKDAVYVVYAVGRKEPPAD